MMAIASFAVILAAALLVGDVTSFQSTSLSISRPSLITRFVYIPDGFTPASYAKFKAEEAKKNAAAKNLGTLGPRGFKSRSMQSFQQALERGEAAHLLPVFNAKEKLAKGQIKKEEIPYMQRGGAWDNSDVSGAKKKKWLESDKQYDNGGFKASASILGSGEGLDWTGNKIRSGPNRTAPKAAAPKAAPKKLFGLF